MARQADRGFGFAGVFAASRRVRAFEVCKLEATDWRVDMGLSDATVAMSRADEMIAFLGRVHIRP